MPPLTPFLKGSVVTNFNDEFTRLMAIAAFEQRISPQLVNIIKGLQVPKPGWDFTQDRPRRTHIVGLTFDFSGVRSQAQSIRLGKHVVEGSMRSQHNCHFPHQEQFR